MMWGKDVPELLHGETNEYLLPNGWKISFPKNWTHEYEPYPEGDQYLFFPEDSDLTFRITSFCVEYQSGYAPIDILKEGFYSSCRKLKKACKIKNSNFFTECFEGITTENGQKVHMVSIGVMVEGFLLIINIFATNRNRIEQALCYVNTICR